MSGSLPPPPKTIQELNEQIAAGGFDALLSDEERDALHKHLAEMANQRRRVEAESRNLAMP